ncbi:hypothetical protein WG66_014236 [Moniliophthora roreri]|nr:hypothetical protein WG66_014236 [Moniliophthora roreri]
MCKRRVEDLRPLNDRLKDPADLGYSACSYPNRTLRYLKKSKPHEIAETFHGFLRCSLCQAGMYCSRHCAERHWKDEAGHRKKCEEWTQARKDGDYYPSDRDSAFLLQLVTEYFSKHGQAIYNELHKFTPPAYLTSPASSTPRSRQEEPFLQRRNCRTQFL